MEDGLTVRLPAVTADGHLVWAFAVAHTAAREEDAELAVELAIDGVAWTEPLRPHHPPPARPFRVVERLRTPVGDVVIEVDLDDALAVDHRLRPERPDPQEA